ncbi:hypothetical protein C0585_08425 [Candidatus Woesearchaeota archaeon]|nr:MAG: hypothetical protein C0585_08425 [Candidatus Woesearchaeota archaeon]
MSKNYFDSYSLDNILSNKIIDDDKYDKYDKYYTKDLSDLILKYDKDYKKNYNNFIDYIPKYYKDDLIPKTNNFIPNSKLGSNQTSGNTGFSYQGLGNLSGIFRDENDMVGPNAYVDPTTEEIRLVTDHLTFVDSLPESVREAYANAVKEIRYFLDGAVRKHFGATNHFNAIRCFNHPEQTDISHVGIPNAQLAGEEFFGLNRFLSNYPDIADVQWWAIYKDGSWRLDTWNPGGEHLDTGYRGWGELVGAVIKVNGKTLTAPETLAFYRTLMLRDSIGFMTPQEHDGLVSDLRTIQVGSIDSVNDDVASKMEKLGLVDNSGLTYVGRSMIQRTVAKDRLAEQTRVQDGLVGQIVNPYRF